LGLDNASLKTRNRKTPKMKKAEKASILKTALELNFYGKRLRDKRLECAEAIIKELGLNLSAANVIAWLDDNKPAKPEKPASEKRAKADNKPDASTVLDGVSSAETATPLDTFDRVVVVSAQNNTAVNVEALAAIQQFCADNDAQLIVLPVWYNKNAFSASVESEHEFFAEQIRPFVVDYTASIFGGLVNLYGNAAVPATTVLPVNVARKLNAGELVSVVGHALQQMDTLPRSPATPIKEAWSTGSVTQINYTRSAAGSKAAANHIFGGLLLERREDGKILTTNLHFKGGKLLCWLTNSEEENNNAVVVLGDLHSEMQDPDNWQRTLEMLDFVKPKLIVLHDILHFSVASHHGRNNGQHLYKMRDRLVIDDLAAVINDLNMLAQIAPLYICESNHHSALDNWLHDINYNAKRDPRQAKLYYLLNYLVAESIDTGDEKTALEVAFQELDRFEEFPELADGITWGDKDQAFINNGFALQTHGHQGTNGARGGANQFMQWQIPMICGHTHSPMIRNGQNPLFVVGVTASLKQGYNAGGASTWNQSHVIAYANGSAQVIPSRMLYA
jgi:hypothetical protein